MVPVTNRRSRFLAFLYGLAAALALVTAGCGGSEDSSSPERGSQQAPARLLIDVTVKDGQVTPTNEALQGKVGQPIVVRVNSDVADELHVHSVPEHTFAIEPKNGQQFQFTVDVPGTVDIELHELNRTVASIQVQQ